MDPDATGQDPGKLVFVLEYEMTLSNQEKYGSVANKVAARIQIQQDNTYAIVPVIKVSPHNLDLFFHNCEGTRGWELLGFFFF